MFEGTYEAPYYNDLYGWRDGAQEDVFQDGVISSLASVASATGVIGSHVSSVLSAAPTTHQSSSSHSSTSTPTSEVQPTTTSHAPSTSKADPTTSVTPSTSEQAHTSATPLTPKVEPTTSAASTLDAVPTSETHSLTSTSVSAGSTGKW